MGASGTRWKSHHAKAYAQSARSRPRRRLPACRREGDPSLACFRKQTKPDNLEDTSPRLRTVSRRCTPLRRHRFFQLAFPSPIRHFMAKFDFYPMTHAQAKKRHAELAAEIR